MFNSYGCVGIGQAGVFPMVGLFGRSKGSITADPDTRQPRATAPQPTPGRNVVEQTAWSLSAGTHSALRQAAVISFTRYSGLPAQAWPAAFKRLMVRRDEVG